MGESNVYAGTPGSASREMWRRELLAEMGVVALYQTRTLPGAGPSPVFDFSAIQAGAADSVQARASIVAGESRAVQAAEAVPARLEQKTPKGNPQAELEAARQALQASVTAPQPEPGRNVSEDLSRQVMPQAPAVPEPESNQDDQPQGSELSVQPFAFTWFGLDTQLAVLAVQPSQQQQLSAASREMLQRIIAALNPRYRQIQLSGQAFHWPLPADLGIGPADDEQAAEQAVLGFIARRLRDRPAQNLLVLGDDELFFLKSRSHPADASGMQSELRREAQFGLTVLQTHSLQSMQTEPALKRSAWKAMQALMPRLAAEANE
ncbi:MAG: hypothetical protein VYE29_02645 [Pseudomonadota bacterium]|nr:hypothetical protein [Gammaproteobacteria bacterium]MEC8858881.1 hypothetical protein [Pseudomonadota bacterium]